MNAQALVTQSSETPLLNLAPMIVPWTKNHNYQIEKAKSRYIQARSEGRLITNLDDKPIDRFHPDLLGFKIKGPALKDDEFSVRILNDLGDETIMFSSAIPEQVAAAEKKFGEYMAKGWTAYVVSRDGKKKRQITAFNAEMCEITFVEPGKTTPLKEKLTTFVKSFGVVQMLPKTVPG